MKKFILVLSILFMCKTFVVAEPPPDFDTDPEYEYLRNNYPRNDNLQEIKAFTEKALNEKGIFQFWEYLFYKKRYAAIYIQAQVFHDNFPEKKYDFGSSDSFLSPVELAFREKQYDLIIELITNFPELSTLPSRNAYGFSLRPPISFAIENNDIELVKVFLKLKVDLDYEKKITEINRNPLNLLSYSRTPEMDSLLKASGVIEMKKLQNSITAHISTSNVRFRSAPNLNSTVIRLLKENDTVEILGYGYKYYNLNSKFEFPHGWYNWFLIRVENETGWTYGEYINIPQR